MLVGLICDCGGAEPLIRSVFKEAGLGNWLSVPVSKGKKASLEFLESRGMTDNPTLSALAYHIRQASAFVVVLGWDNAEIRWADVHNGGIKNRLDAQIIASQFA